MSCFEKLFAIMAQFFHYLEILSFKLPQNVAGMEIDSCYA